MIDQDSRTGIQNNMDGMEYESFPWVLFKLNANVYAINSRYVISISQRPNEVTPLLEAPAYVDGIMELREEMVPLIDTKKLFHLLSTEETVQEFIALIDQVKKEHQLLMDVMEQGIKTKKQFDSTVYFEELSLAKFIKDFKSDNLRLMQQVALLDAPLKALHDSALEIIHCSNLCHLCARKECQYKALKRSKDLYGPKIIDILEGCLAIAGKSQKEMVIALSGVETSVGFCIDQVVSVENIRVVSTSNTTKSLHTSEYLYGVGIRLNDNNAMEDNRVTEINQHQQEIRTNTQESNIIILLNDQSLLGVCGA